MNSRGFTLVEMMLVILVVGILSSIAVPRFTEMNNKEKIRSQTKQLQTDLMTIRVAALQERKRSIVFFGPQQYVYKTYSSVNESITAGTAVRTVRLPFAMKRKTGATLATLVSTSDCIEFGRNGLTDTTNCANSNMTLVVTPVSYGGGSNCVVIGAARTNMGRMDNVSTCRMQ